MEIGDWNINGRMIHCMNLCPAQPFFLFDIQSAFFELYSTVIKPEIHHSNSILVTLLQFLYPKKAFVHF